MHFWHRWTKWTEPKEICNGVLTQNAQERHCEKCGLVQRVYL